MLKVCGDSIYNPLKIISRQALLTGVFSSEWNKGNIVPVHTKNWQANIKILKTIVQFLCFLFEIKSFRE